MQNLPTELIEEIFSAYRSLRLRRALEPGDGSQRCGSEYAENAVRKATLHALCLTSKRLSQISTPILYEEVFIKDPDDDVSPQIMLVLRTIISNPELSRLVKYLHVPHVMGVQENLYNCLSEDDRRMLIDAGERLWTGDMLGRWSLDIQIATEQALLALLLWLTANLTHLTLGTYNGSLKRILGTDSFDDIRDPEKFHGYRKLESLDMFNDFYHLSDLKDVVPKPEPFPELIVSLATLPSLRRFRNAYACAYGTGHRIDTITCQSSWTMSLDTLQVLNLTECSANFLDVNKFLGACHSLKEFRYRAMDYQTFLDYGSLCETLLHFKETLEYLYLGMGYEFISTHPFDKFSFPQPGTFTKFKRLKTLCIPIVVLLGAPCLSPFDPNIANAWEEYRCGLSIVQCLPATLEGLGISDELAALETQAGYERTVHFALRAGWELVRDLDKIPQLRTLRIFLLQGGMYEWPKYKAEIAALMDEDGVRGNWKGVEVRVSHEDDLELLAKHYGGTGEAKYSKT